jgi:hypothetical protein
MMGLNIPKLDGLVEALEAARAPYPTPLGASHGQCLIDMAHAVRRFGLTLPADHRYRPWLLRAGLLKKDGGTFVELPDGARVSQDCIAFPTGHAEHYDVLNDGEGAAVVVWGEHYTYLPNDDRYLDVAAYAASGSLPSGDEEADVNDAKPQPPAPPVLPSAPLLDVSLLEQRIVAAIIGALQPQLALTLGAAAAARAAAEDAAEIVAQEREIELKIPYFGMARGVIKEA